MTENLKIRQEGFVFAFPFGKAIIQNVPTYDLNYALNISKQWRLQKINLYPYDNLADLEDLEDSPYVIIGSEPQFYKDSVNNGDIFTDPIVYDYGNNQYAALLPFEL